jgi:thioester reductase-like protein
MKRNPRAMALLFLLLAPLAQNAVAAAPDQNSYLDTVTVKATRAQLDKVLQEMVKSEDDFFKRYNALNTNDDFDMTCYREARGTNARRRYCVPVYVKKALQAQGQSQASNLQQNFDSSQRGTTFDTGGSSQMPMVGAMLSAGAPPVTTEASVSAQALIEARRKDFQQNMRDVVSRNPELIEMLRQRDELGKRYETMRSQLLAPGSPKEPVAP